MKQCSEHQIRGGTEDNSKITFLTFLMMGHKIGFNGEIWLIIPKLSLLPLLICSTRNCSLSMEKPSNNYSRPSIAQTLMAC